MAEKLKQCAILVINPDQRALHALDGLRKGGFVVRETCEWPDNAALDGAEAVILVLAQTTGLTMLAARLRAKPRFGRRVLIALTSPALSTEARRAAESSGFDDVLEQTCEPRRLRGRLTRRLRARPELRCALPRRRRAA